MIELTTDDNPMQKTTTQGRIMTTPRLIHKDNDSRNRRSAPSSLYRKPWFYIIGVAAMIYVICSLRKDATTNKDKTIQNESALSASSSGAGTKVETLSVADNEIQLKNMNLPNQDVPYYICHRHRSSSSSNTNKYNLILLHGSRFTKEDWKTSGILNQFCFDIILNNDIHDDIDITVFAMDFPITATRIELQNLIQYIDDNYNTINHETNTNTINVLVTPSASGKCIHDFIINGKENINKYIQIWIPVAPGSIMDIDDSQLKNQLKNLSSIIAIYGNLDMGGKIVSEKIINAVANSVQEENNDEQNINQMKKIIELPGKHPVYLDSPDAFVRVVMDALYEYNLNE